MLNEDVIEKNIAHAEFPGGEKILLA